MQIRVASERDIPAMQRIRLGVLENRLADPSRVQPHHVEEMILRRGRGWVAEIDGRIAGFAIADLQRTNIWALFVDPPFERRGVGRALHDVMLRWLFAQGVESVWLSTDPGTRAEAFYGSAGWRRVGQEENGEVRFEMSRVEACERGFAARSAAGGAASRQR